MAEDMVEDISLDLVPYTTENAEGLITEGLTVPPPKPRTQEEHMALHSNVVEKTDLIIDGICSMNIYSLWWIE
jgi:hypothetical protein